MKNAIYFCFVMLLALSVSCKKNTTEAADVSKDSTTTTTEIKTEQVSEKEQTAKEEIKTDSLTTNLPLRWTLLTKHTAGDYVVFDECRYGPQALVFEDNYTWFEMKGGGDAVNYDIVELTRELDKIIIQYSNVGEQNTLIISELNQERVLFTFDDDARYYTNQKNLSNFRVYKEECDED